MLAEASELSPLELKQLSSVILEVLQTYPKDDEHLLLWIEAVSGKRIPYKVVCEDHQSPGQLICDLFFHRVSDAIGIGARSTGKTAGISTLHAANSYHKPGFLTTHYGATETQAHRAYSEYKAMIESDIFSNELEEVHVKESTWRNGSKLEILPGTERQTQGAHSHICTYDELESSQIIPYENAKSVPMEYKTPDSPRKPGQFVAISTRNTAFGLVQKALEDAKKSINTKIYMWCVFESMEPCDGEKDHYTCTGAECPIYKYCGPCNCTDKDKINSKLQIKDHGKAVHAEGWRSYNDIIALYDRVDQDTWEAQHLCLKPLSKALIYSNFTDENISLDATYIPNGGPIYIFFDWGFAEDTHIIICQLRDNKFYQFEELVGKKVSEQDWVRKVLELITLLPDYKGPTMEQWQEYWIKGFPYDFEWPRLPFVVGDPTATQFYFEFKEHGFPVADTKRVKHLVKSGQGVLRSAIKASSNNIRLFIHPSCVKTLKAFRNYRAKQLDTGGFLDIPDLSPQNHEYSHGCDSWRYGIWFCKYLLGLNMPDNIEEGEKSE